MSTASHAAPDDARTRTRADVPTVPDAANKSAISGAQHDAEFPAEEDPIERITRSIPMIIPAAGAVLIFLLAFIAVFMA